ncbi:hypothetical protein ACVIU7_006939 [Bradyrhizobium liaoningense]
MEDVQHAVAHEPVRAGRFELRIGPVAVERAVQLARQFADDLEDGRVGLERDRCDIAAALGDLLHGVAPYLYIVKIR